MKASPDLPPRRGVIGFVLHLALLGALREVGTWRWALVPPFFAVATYLFQWSVLFDFERDRSLEVNQWDFVLTYQVHTHFLVWVFAFGFAVLAGDCLVREREQGFLLQSLVRAPSRTAWWMARVGSLGLMALTYTLAGFTTILLVGGVLSRFALGPSPASLGVDGAVVPYLRCMDIPIALFVPLTWLYMSYGLWLVGSVIVTASLFIRNAFTPFIAAVAWLMLSFAPPFGGTTRWLNLAYLLSYQKHIRYEAPSFGSFLALSAVALVAVTLAGTWRLRHLDA